MFGSIKNANVSEAQIIECVKNGWGSVFNYMAVPALYTEKGNGMVLKRAL